MSTINTNGLSVNYPVPGINNNSQGFRDNFTSIKTNLNTAGTEITDLQSKVIVKSALANSTVNNNMAGTLISNALTRSFRATTFNLGNNIAGDLTIDVSLGDVQYGTIAGDTNLSFIGWSVAGTQSSVELQFTVTSETATVINLPAAISAADCLGVTTIENFDGVSSITIPAGVCQLNYKLSTIDCGTSVSISPINRPRRSTQIRQRTPSPVGFQGDVAGTVSVDANYFYVCTGSYAATTVTKSISATYTEPSVGFGGLINCGTTTGLVVNVPIIFSANWPGGDLFANTVYYIKDVYDGSNITVSLTGFNGTAGAGVYTTAYSPSGSSGVSASSYNGTSIWKRGSLTQGLAEFGDATVTGTLNVLSGSLELAAPSSLYVGGGTNGYVLQTDGAGSLSWVAQIAPGSGSNPGGANTNIQFNDAGTMNGVVGFNFNKSTNVMTVPGDITVTGDFVGQDFTATGNVTSEVYIIGGAIASNSLIIAAGNITGGNLVGPLANGTSNVRVFDGGNIAMAVGGVANIAVVASTGLGVVGNITAGNIIGTSSVGYATGSGGVVTQITSRTTSVAINKITGAITLVSAAGTTAYQTFTVNNSTVVATDVIIINQKFGTDKYEAYVTNVGTGSFAITFATTGGTTTEQPIFNFAVIKGVTA